MEVVIFIGIQATGKTSFYQERYSRSHVHITLDMLKTRNRENILYQACLTAKQPVVVDNTNPGKEDRRRYIEPARLAGFRVAGCYFESKTNDALQRNERRDPDLFVPVRGLLGTRNRLVIPDYSEGFDELFYVCIRNGRFEVSEWKDEI
ncbi:MAG: AAA family ATPase [Leptonema illini]|uniref:AAA family ATPase n=1 Tax=Leptonema illini TaxID=183 RepID=A0A833GY93_9LEPT|nr:MAG: AAA family ATPase [Leptonema illini]